MALPKINMTHYVDSRADAALSAEGMLQAFPGDSVSITTTPQGRYAVQSVRTVTSELSDDTDEEQVATFFSQTQVNT